MLSAEGALRGCKDLLRRKKKIYGLKSEVGVQAAPPHYCLFVQPHDEGSRHDYEKFKKSFVTYLPYLQKLPDEEIHLPGDVGKRFWAAILDKAYIGPATDTPDLRRITPRKAPQIQAQETYNINVSRQRVPVEQFFGRLCTLWAVASKVYRWTTRTLTWTSKICSSSPTNILKKTNLEN